MSTRHIAAEDARLADLTPKGSSGGASKRFRQKLAADGFTVDDGFRLKPGYLYTVVRAISARVNQNYDGWPSDELKKSYRTFIGKPVFVNHENHDPTKARGVVVAARYAENGMDKYIEVVQEIDANRFPKLAHEIKTGGLDSVSMGAEAGFTICSYCHNKATDLHDMCDHVINHKGKTLSRLDRKTGRKEDVLVFESCHKISFFELSYVFEPADETAVASKVVVAAKEVRVDDHDDDDEYDPTKDPHSFEYQDPDLAEGYCADCEGELGERGVSMPQMYGNQKNGYDMLCEDCHAKRSNWDISDEMDVYRGWNPDDNPGPDDPRIKGASVHKHSGDCPPGMDCSRNTGLLNDMEQITKDSPNNPVNQVSYTPGNVGDPGSAGGAGGYQGSGKSGRDGLNPAVRDFYDQIAKDHADLSLGGYNPVVDQPWDEHGTGDAMDIMISDLERGNSIRDQALKNPNVKHVIWQQHLYRPDGSSYKMPDRFSPTENHMDHLHINIPTPAGYKAPSPTITTTTAPAASTPAPAQRAAGKYTKEDFAVGDGKKPWERDTGTTRAPVEDEAADLKEIEAMMRPPRLARSLTDEYLDYMYGEYGGTDWDVPNSPTDVMYDEADHGRGRGHGGGPSGPGGPLVHHTAAGRVPRQLKGLVSSWIPLRGAPTPDPRLPVYAHYYIPAADKQRAALRHHINDPKDPKYDPSRPTLPRSEASLLAEQPDLWSIEQTDPITGKPRVRGYTNQLHLHNVSFDINRSGQKTTQTTGRKGVHAGVSGIMIPQPNEPLEYSKVEYNPYTNMDFVHSENQETIGDPDEWAQRRGVRSPSTPSGYRSNGVADHVHLSPDMSMYASRADNFGLEQPKVVVPLHPSVNAANPDTVIAGFKPNAEQHPEVADRTRDVMERRRMIDEAKGRTVVGMRKIARKRALKLAFGEKEAPMAVDTLREEGSAPEDDNNDDQRYVDPPEFENAISSPQELQDPDLSQASQIDREQELAESGGDPNSMGQPGAADPNAVEPQAPQQQFMTLQIPIPPQGMPQVPQQAAPPQMPAPQQIAASVLDYFDGYYGRRVANWLDAIEAGRDMNPAEVADYRRQAGKLSTLENGRELSTTNRNPTKGTANMARNSIARRNKVATAGRRQHFAEGPLVDGGDRSRNDQGEQEEAFISQTPPEVPVDFPSDDAMNISNTENNLVARVQRGRAQLLRDAQQLASLRQRRAFDESGGPTAEIVDPQVNTGPEGEELTGTDFVSADPNDGVVPTNPKDASLRAFKAFDGWLTSKTGKSSRRHTEATIKKAAAAFSREAGISPQMLFPALGIVLREARKNDKIAKTKGAKMRKRADEKLEVAAPDGRVDVEAPVSNTTDAEAQASQFDLRDFGDNAGDNVADPDLSTDQNWAPGEASKTSARVKTAGGLLAMRCAEGMIEAGLEPNSRERKYQLAAEFERMNRGLIQDRVALLERFAAVRLAERRKVASGSSRGAARSPIPAGLGGGTRTASAGMRLAANDPSNDSSLFI